MTDSVAANPAALPGPHTTQAPDFVLVLVREGDQHLIYASRELTHAQLDAIVENRPGDLRDPLEHGVLVHFRLSATLKTYVVAAGSSYPEAFQTLFETWHPDDQSGDGAMPEIEGIRELPR